MLRKALCSEMFWMTTSPEIRLKKAFYIYQLAIEDVTSYRWLLDVFLSGLV